jgi:hypothetical protein
MIARQSETEKNCTREETRDAQDSPEENQLHRSIECVHHDKLTSLTGTKVKLRDLLQIRRSMLNKSAIPKTALLKELKKLTNDTAFGATH